MSTKQQVLVRYLDFLSWRGRDGVIPFLLGTMAEALSDFLWSEVTLKECWVNMKYLCQEKGEAELENAENRNVLKIRVLHLVNFLTFLQESLVFYTLLVDSISSTHIFQSYFQGTFFNSHRV